jgi:uroporphyrin-III C-methyltransferase/precorrin-2 dehydrogenase/sirohydrochlorin ferrochelatase
MAEAGGRIAPLAKLPVFLDLARRRAVVAGGSAAAAWKAELLAAAGANVEAIAAHPGVELRRLAGEGRIALIERAWTHADLPGAAIAVLDAGDESEAAAFAGAARAAGVLVNSIDDPARCDFQFGAIVNRSPVLVGITTDGAAPILGQAIRRRIEAILPAGIADWAAAAKRLRERVASRLASPALRRSFWEHFVDLALSAARPEDPESQLARRLEISPADGRGRVVLVGAGPGDAELLTLKAVRALQAADVILFDDLVSADVLELARREAQRIRVGKRGGRASCRQGDINALMIRLARGGKRVVRLKSGDPMIFGRAGEELDELATADIPVEVVPGITAALAMAAALGISLTHRDLAHSVRFVTGHGRDGSLPAYLDWKGLADPETTLVVYMGRKAVGDLTDRLVGAGLCATTPACAVAAISRSTEQRWLGTLGSLKVGAASLAAKEPVLIAIGTAIGRPAAAAGDGGPPACPVGKLWGTLPAANLSR